MDNKNTNITNSVIDSFFRAISERINKENGLSDITYVMCRTSERFSRLFLCFMFPGESFSGNGHWEREYVGRIPIDEKGSRIDFYYNEDERQYVIENKIYDQDTHDEQYMKAFPDSDGYKRSFIANYSFKGRFYYHCETWKNFYRKLEDVQFDETDIEGELVIGYRLYLARLINYMEAKKMDLSNIQSIRSFFIIINEFVDKTKDKWNLNLYKRSGDFVDSSDDWIGKWYSDDMSNAFYFCLELHGELPEFAVWIKPKWRVSVDFDTSIRKAIKEKQPILINSEKIEFDKYEWGTGLYMDLNTWKDTFFNSQKTLSDQQKCIEMFIEEVLETTYSVL